MSDFLPMSFRMPDGLPELMAVLEETWSGHLAEIRASGVPTNEFDEAAAEPEAPVVVAGERVVDAEPAAPAVPVEPQGVEPAEGETDPLLATILDAETPDGYGYLDGYERALVDLGLAEPEPPDPEQDPATWMEWARERTEELKQGNLELVQQLADQAGVDPQELHAAFQQHWAEQQQAQAEQEAYRQAAELQMQLGNMEVARRHIAGLVDQVGVAGVDVDEVLDYARAGYANLVASHGEEFARENGERLLQLAVEHQAEKLAGGYERLGHIAEQVGRVLSPGHPPDIARVIDAAEEMSQRLAHVYGADDRAVVRDAMDLALRMESGWDVRQNEHGDTLPGARVPANMRVTDYHAALQAAMPQAPPPSPVEQPKVHLARDANGRFVAKESVTGRYAREERERERVQAHQARMREAGLLQGGVT